MNVIKAKIMGTCFGVSNSIKLLKDTFYNNKTNKPIYVFGNLVHNKKVTQIIASMGIESILSPKGHAPGIVVVRAHGMENRIYEEFISSGFEVVDSTCHYVKRNINAVLKETKPILYIGRKNHAETISCVNSCVTPYTVIEKAEDVANLDLSKEYDCFVQTTFETAEYDEIIAKMNALGVKYAIKSSICNASVMRRAAVDELCKSVSEVIVLGDVTSANSLALKTTVENCGAKAYLIEDEDELNKIHFSSDTIGLTAAASVTDEMLDSLYKHLISL